MNIAFWIFAIWAALGFSACGQANEHQTLQATQRDTVTTAVDRAKEERLEKMREEEEQQKLDSIKDSRVLEEALAISEQHGRKGNFHKVYVSAIEDSFYGAEVDIKEGFYFSDKIRHLVVRRTKPGSVSIDVFARKGNQAQKVFSLEQSEYEMDYLGEIIRDINGDGLKDFVVHWSSNRGCCLRDNSDIFLQRPDKVTFSRNFQFINPTFSPKDQMIRGLCYGQPGETAMYKYRWNGEAVDTVEYIYYEKNTEGQKTGKLIVSNDRYNYDKNLKRLSYIPSEYKKIDGYYWFINKLEN